MPTLAGESIDSIEEIEEIEEIEPDRPPVLPPSLEITDFDQAPPVAQPTPDPAPPGALFQGVSEPGLYAEVPTPELDPDELPTPPMGTSFPGRVEPDLYAAEGAKVPTPVSATARLAQLRQDAGSESSPYLGDIQASTSDLTPTDAKMQMTDEVLDLESDTAEFGARPAPVAVDPTTPVSVWPEERTPPAADLEPPRPEPPPEPPQPLVAGRGFEVLPDFDYEPEPVAPGEEPARTGETIIADPRTYQWPPVGADVSGPHQVPEEPEASGPYPMPTPGPETSGARPVPPPPPSTPDGYAVVPLLDTEQASVSGFTIVASDLELEERAQMSVLTGAGPGQQPGLEESMTSMYTPLPEYPDAEDTATTLHDPGGASRGRTISPEEGLRLSMPGAAVVPEAAESRRSTNLAGAGPAPMPVLNRRPPPAPAAQPAPKHTHIEISGRPAPPPPKESTGPGLNGSRHAPPVRGSGNVARPQRGNRPGMENAATRSFPVVPPLASDPNVHGAGRQVARPPASEDTTRRHPSGEHAAASSSGQYPVAARAAQHGSGQHPAAQSGQHPVARSGQHGSGQHPAARSGQHGSGQHPVAAQSGQHPAVQQAPVHGGNGRPPPSMVPTGPHQPVGVTPPSQVPTGPHDVFNPKAEKRALVEDALAQLKARTAEKRAKRGVTAEQEAVPKQTRRKRRGVPQSAGADPQLADLFRAAIKDLERPAEE